MPRQMLVAKDVVVDVKTTNCCNILYGRCYCQCGRWNSHCRVDVVVADVNAMWQME